VPRWRDRLDSLGDEIALQTPVLFTRDEAPLVRTGGGWVQA
jgi:hypothetical protein